MFPDEQLLQCADEYGLIRCIGLSRQTALRLVQRGLLVQLSYSVFSLPEGG